MSKWTIVKLGEVATYINGYAFKPSDWSDVGLPIIRIQDLTGNNYETNFYSGEYDPKYEINDGDILISWSASLGIYKWNSGKAVLNQHIFKVVFDKLQIDKNYYFYAVEYLLDDMTKETHGSTMKHITKPRFDNTFFPYPPIQIQRRIAETLDKVNLLISICRDMLIKCDTLVKSQFVEMFGDPVTNEKHWEMKPLLSMGNCKNGMNFHRDDKGVEINCLGVGDFNDSSTIEDTSKLPTISLNEIPSEEYLLKNDDIVFVRSNGNKALVGRSIAVYPEKIPTTFSGFCIRYRRTDDSVNTPYLLRFFKAESIRQRMVGRGANIQNLNQQILGELIIPVPPLDLQNQFADFVKTIDKSKFDVQLLIKNIRRVKFYDQF